MFTVEIWHIGEDVTPSWLRRRCYRLWADAKTEGIIAKDEFESEMHRDYMLNPVRIVIRADRYEVVL